MSDEDIPSYKIRDLREMDQHSVFHQIPNDSFFKHEQTFVACLFIDIDRKLSSKMKSNLEYQPSKRKAIAFALALI